MAAPTSGDGVNGISFDDLVFDIQPGQPFEPSMLNDSVRGWFDKRVKIRGFILPFSVSQDKGFDSFILVRDDQECCFGPQAALYDCVFVKMDPGKTANFRTIPITVTGVLRLRPVMGPNGIHLGIFRLESEGVE